MKKIEPAPPPSLSQTLRDMNIATLTSEKMTSLLNKINEEYYYWDKVKHQPFPENVDPKAVWQLVKVRRQTTPYKVSFGKFKFHWNLNSRFQGTLHFLDMNIGGTLESSSIISKGDKNRYLLSSIMEEAIASSQIEGAVTTRRQAKEMLRKNIKPRNVSEQMIYNNYVTIQKILEFKSQPLTMENFLSVHKLVTTNTLSNHSEEGYLRIDNEIKVIDMTDGSIVHHPPDKNELNELLKDLFKFFNEDDPKLFIHPIVKACIIHFMIGFIHPFSDGNGRTSRALFYWYLLKKEYWLIEYLSISRLILRSKAQYARAFQYCEIDDNDLTYFIAYNLKTMKLAFDELRVYIKRKNEEKKQLTDFLNLDGINYRQAHILEWFAQEPTLLVTVKEVEKRLGISNASARTDLTELSVKGYLSTKNINKVMKGYVKGDKLDLVIASKRPRKKIKFDLSQQKLFNPF